MPEQLADRIKLVRQYAQELRDQGYISYPWEYEDIHTAMLAVCEAADPATIGEYADYYSEAARLFSVTGETPMTIPNGWPMPTRRRQGLTMLPIWTLKLAGAAIAFMIGCGVAVAVTLLGYMLLSMAGIKPSMPGSNLLWLGAGFIAGLVTLDVYRHMMKLRDIW